MHSPLPESGSSTQNDLPSIESAASLDKATLPSVAFAQSMKLDGDLNDPISNRKRKRRRRTNFLLWIPLLILAAGYFVYVFVIPEIELALYRWRYPNRHFLPSNLDLQFANRNMLRTTEFLFVVWIFYFGASIGSFLNVVAWRVPEGRGIVFGGSKCPFCNTRLSFLDNTPVIGWLYLRGKCRTCRLPISSRYLWIEILTGSVFLFLTLFQLMRGGANLPNWISQGRGDLVSNIFDPQWDLIGLTVLHAFLFAFLIMLGFANDGQKPFPISGALWIAGLLALPFFFNGSLELVAWSEPFAKEVFTKRSPYIDVALSILIGGWVGWCAGWLTSWGGSSQGEKRVVRHWCLMCFLLGVVLGWQSVVTIVMVSCVVLGISHMLARMHSKPVPWTHSSYPTIAVACLITTALLHQAFWRPIAHLLHII